MMKLSEFAIPKMRAVDTNFNVGEDSGIANIKIEVVTKEKNEGTNHTGDGGIQ